MRDAAAANVRTHEDVSNQSMQSVHHPETEEPGSRACRMTHRKQPCVQGQGKQGKHGPVHSHTLAALIAALRRPFLPHSSAVVCTQAFVSERARARACQQRSRDEPGPSQHRSRRESAPLSSRVSTALVASQRPSRRESAPLSSRVSAPLVTSQHPSRHESAPLSSRVSTALVASRNPLWVLPATRSVLIVSRCETLSQADAFHRRANIAIGGAVRVNLPDGALSCKHGARSANAMAPFLLLGQRRVLKRLGLSVLACVPFSDGSAFEFKRTRV